MILVAILVLGVFLLQLIDIFIRRRNECAKRILEMMEEEKSIRSSDYEYGDERLVSSLQIVDFEQCYLSSQLPPIVVNLVSRGKCPDSPKGAEYFQEGEDFTRLWEEEFGDPTTRL